MTVSNIFDGFPMQYGINNHGAQRNFNDFIDPLTFALVPALSFHIYLKDWHTYMYRYPWSPDDEA